MSDAKANQAREAFVANALEATIRIGIVLLLAAWCFQIVRPFVEPVAWGLIIAVSSRPLFTKLESGLGGRTWLAATAFVVAGLLLVIGPVLGLAATMVGETDDLNSFIHEQGVLIPPPPSALKDLPIIGEPAFRIWSLATTNLTAVLAKVQPQIQALAGWLLAAAASAGLGIMVFAAAIVVAGLVHTRAESAQRFAHGLAERLAGDRGPALANLAESTVRGVTKGILGVALIQALLAGVGMVAVGVPAAGLWALVVMIVAVIQLPSFLVTLPVAIYVFQVESTGIAVAFAIWAVLVGFSDNFLKPILLSRGVDVPMLVIFMGAIGGFASNGVIGLFLGAIVLSVGYRLFLAWLEMTDEDAPVEAPAEGSEA